MIYSGRIFILLFCFLIISGFFFSIYLDAFYNIRKAIQEGASTPGFIQFINAWCGVLPINTLLLVPCLTMSAYSDEKNQNTLPLIITSPLAGHELALGKYLSLVFVSMVCCFLLLPYWCFCVCLGSLDFGVMFSSTLGFFMLLNFLFSIGSFLSTFSESSLKNFLIIFLFLLALVFIGQLSLVFQRILWLQDLCNYLAWNTHLSSFFSGRISSKDIGYFMSFTCFFLYITVLRARALING